jgi:LmbE family N-acetylglucosaminyl deacetylase
MERGPESVVFLHAHPDDEAIFTGGTMARLANTGWRVVLVVATGGELGAAPTGTDPGPAVARLREAETRRAATALGVARVEFLGYHDSGFSGDVANRADGAFCQADVQEVTDRLTAVLREEAARALVIYDEDGIYGHPDHVMVHRAGTAAARAAGVETLYEATVDREYLHFVETHVVAEARQAIAGLGLAATGVGVPTVLVSTTVDVRSVISAKRAAMAAHASQIPETASVMQLPTGDFTAVYGYEWFVRHGPPGPIETLAG